MEIITNGYPKGDQILVDQVTITYYQSNDCTEHDEEGQTLTIETRNNGMENFYHIKTEGWSIDNENSLTEILKDFIKRIS